MPDQRGVGRPGRHEPVSGEPRAHGGADAPRPRFLPPDPVAAAQPALPADGIGGRSAPAGTPGPPPPGPPGSGYATPGGPPGAPGRPDGSAPAGRGAAQDFGPGTTRALRWAGGALGGGLGAVSLAIVVVAALLIVRTAHRARPDAGMVALPAPAPTASPRTTPPPALPTAPPRASRPLPVFRGTPAPVTGRIVDRAAGLSYARLGPPWQVGTARIGDEFAAGQFFVTEVYGPARSRWYAAALSGPLDPAAAAAYRGRHREFRAALAEEQSVEDRLYPAPHRRTEIAAQPLVVSRRPGWLVAARVHYREPGLKASSDLVVVVVVDTGRPRPGILFITIPDTRAARQADVRVLLRSLRVVR